MVRSVATARASRTTRPRLILRPSRLARFAHALAKALDQPQRARRPALAAAAQHIHDPRLDRIDQFLGLGPERDDELIERFEPSHFQKLWPRHVEHEGRDADAQE